MSLTQLVSGVALLTFWLMTQPQKIPLNTKYRFSILNNCIVVSYCRHFFLFPVSPFFNLYTCLYDLLFVCSSFFFASTETVFPCLCALDFIFISLILFLYFRYVYCVGLRTLEMPIVLVKVGNAEHVAHA